MKFSLGAGAEVDIATGDELQDAVKDLKTEIALCQPKHDPRPIRRKFLLGRNNNNTVYDSAHTAVVVTADGAILSPSVGRIWDVRSTSLFVPGNPSHQFNATTAFSLNGGDPNLPSSIDIRQGVSAGGLFVPSSTFTKGAVLVNPNEELYAVVLEFGAGAASSYAVVIEVDDYSMDCYESQNI